MRNELKDQYKNAENLDARIRLHLLYGTNKYSWQRWVFDHFDLSRSARILELGCGPGNLWLKNSDRIPAGWDVVLSDFSEGMVEEAKKNLSESRHNFSFAVIDAQSIPYPDGSFDAVIANHMLYHVPDKEKALSEIMRVLKQNGYLYATTIGESHMKELKILHQKFGLKTNEIFSDRNFTLENGTKQLERWFKKIRVDKYQSELKVTNAKHLLEYILSEAVSIGEEKITKFKNFVEQEIAKKGFISINTYAGIFVAQKSRQ